MTASGIEGFLLTEVFEPPPRVDTPPRERPVLPSTIRLRSIDPGFVLTWREIPTDGPMYRRRGMVVALAPRERSVWVLPDDPREGEGFAVVVDGVTIDSWAGAERRLGVPGDLLSSAAWQAPPHSLPRAILRGDRVSYGGPATVQPYLHAAAGCPLPPRPFMAEEFERGEDVPAEDCYVVDGYLHPLSVRPTQPSTSEHGSRYVPVCECLRAERPK